jgi:hypothetical protein
MWCSNDKTLGGKRIGATRNGATRVDNMSRADFPVEKRSAFLERVAARLQMLGSFTDRDFDDAVRLALRGLIQESAA